MPRRTILHVDLNSFFATAEQQANPFLRNKPVGILKAEGRSCIIAASIEAKKYGVKTCSNVFEAKKLCPQIILIPADFSKYAHITYKFIDICRTYSPACEVFSLDECFIDVTETEKFWGHVFNIAFEIKDRLRAEVGDYMKCSVGVSHNRMLAKLASSQQKDDGLFWITDDNKLEVLDKSHLMDVCGLGFGLYRHLTKLGINSFPKLRTLSLPFLVSHFGPFWSKHLYNIARGIDESPVGNTLNIPDAKSVGRTYTTHRNLETKAEVLKLVRNLCEEASEKARKMGLSGRYVAITLRGGEKSNVKHEGWQAFRNFGESYFGHRTLKRYIDNGKDFFEICKSISASWPVSDVRFCGVTLGMLTKTECLTKPLFPWDVRRDTLVNTVDGINDKHGNYTVFPGQLLGMPLIMPEVNGFLGDKKYRLDFLRNG